MRISVLGCGRWGSFIAWYLNSIGHDTVLYGRPHSASMAAFLNNRTNGMVTLPERLALSTDLSMAVGHGEVIVISIGAQNLRSFLKDLLNAGYQKKQPIVLCMKGIEDGTGLRLSEVAAEVLGIDAPIAIWVGPGHVQDFTAGIPNCMVIDSLNKDLKYHLVHAFSSDLIRFYYGSDLIGNEIGAASKNVIGIAAGMLDGAGVSSLKGALIARGPREISRLIEAMGGQGITAYGLGHLGDYAATVFSPYSHNRAVGEAFIKKEGYRQLAEGIATASAITLLSKRYGVEMPICTGVNAVLSGKMEAGVLLSGLFMRSLKEEF
ncbi:MAG: NAD(P)H-dependent glycerol-3-phosphate dehydrogenase [Clostridiales bacterium]|nr:NAD(P)H-dependent glycerol-3-phosphate dehydrogenase [Clostridiales bacterium]